MATWNKSAKHEGIGVAMDAAHIVQLRRDARERKCSRQDTWVANDPPTVSIAAHGDEVACPPRAFCVPVPAPRPFLLPRARSAILAFRDASRPGFHPSERSLWNRCLNPSKTAVRSNDPSERGDDPKRVLRTWQGSSRSHGGKEIERRRLQSACRQISSVWAKGRTAHGVGRPAVLPTVRGPGDRAGWKGAIVRERKGI